MNEKNVTVDINRFRNIPENKKFICLFSGGKDSGLAFSFAKDKAIPHSIIHCVGNKDNVSINHFQSLNTIEKQAIAMDIPIIYHNDHWSKWPKLIKLFNQFKQQGVEFVVFGDICREDNVKMLITLCKSSDLVPCFPLWLRPYEELLQEIKKRNIKSIITSIDSPHISRTWLGYEFSETVFNAFQNLPIDPFGEYGEFHTTLVDADFYKSPLKYEYGKTVLDLEISNYL